MRGLPKIDVDIRMTYPTSNTVERPGAHLVITDEASNLPLLRVYLSDSDLLDLLASRGVHVTGERTPMVENIGKKLRRENVKLAQYVPGGALEELYLYAEKDAAHYGWTSWNRRQNRDGYWLEVSYWGDGGPSAEMLDEQRARAKGRLSLLPDAR